MVGSSVSEILFISVNRSITLMGKVWLIVMIFLRVLILLFAGYPLYRDEQERFVCNTIQPGCANVCYDLFSPVSLFRFWLLQLVTLCLPYIIFVIYVIHKVSNALSAALNSTGHVKTFQLFKPHREKFNQMRLNKVAEQRGGPRSFAGAYILHLLFRTLLEAGFGAAHYYMFGFYIPKRFLCQHVPCTTQVDCYISRPTEKTVMLNFMLAVAALSLFLNVLDFIWAIKRSLKHSKRRMTVEKIFEEERCFLSDGVESSGMDAKSSPTLQNLEAQLGKTESFRKRRGSKTSRGGETLYSGQEASTLERCSHPSGPPCCNSGNNDILISQEEVLERNGSEVALCPQETLGTPRSIRVSKRSRLKPPPPPRLDIRLPSGELVPPVRDISTKTAVCTRGGQYSLFELGNGVELQSSEGGQEKRSEWV
ncbi:PREDICTED: gap junction delta-4 protein [Cyprinodon variegatus]|uniref:gap junction delta-4 protein n=1 Tax=Cyprinodon variegatus TaxID=28743 RepID=UPI000742B0DD|nr:PREDICTED: gap junction delta-4 protein [Cyprinodon variegatus]